MQKIGMLSFRTRVHIFALFIFQLFSSDYDYSLLSAFLVVYIFEGGLSSVLIANFISDMQHNSLYPPGSISIYHASARGAKLLLRSVSMTDSISFSVFPRNKRYHFVHCTPPYHEQNKKLLK